MVNAVMRTMRRESGRRGIPAAGAVVLGGCGLLLLLLSGCQSPIQPESADDLHRQLVESVRRELDALPEDIPVVMTQQPPAEVEQALAGRREELDRMAGPQSYPAAPPVLGIDLIGREQMQVGMNLQQSIGSAVENNLALQVARIQPSISASEVIAEQAVFDAVFFASANHRRTDEPTAVPVLNNIPLGAGASVRDDSDIEVGIRKPFETGGELTASTSVARGNNMTPGFSTAPDPSYNTRLTFGLSQPLLRGFGSAVNTSQIRLAENADRRAIQDLRGSLLLLVESTETAYWNLVVAQHTFAVQQRLLERGIETRDFMKRRAEVRQDVRDSQLADAIATVERRQADTIRIRRAIRAASDQLKAIMNDPEVTVGSEILVNATDVLIEEPLEYNLREILIAAIDKRPEIQQAILALDDAAIGVEVADNLRLPLLNLTAQVEFVGLGEDAGEAYSQTTDDTFVDYVVGMIFEQPIGNRAAEAEYRIARLRQSQAVIEYRRAVQDVVLDVKSALRDVVTNFELIQATRSARVAAAENLRAILVDEEFREVPTPEFLNLKLQRQEALALAEVEEIRALANYSKSLASLYRAMGIGLEVNQIDVALP